MNRSDSPPSTGRLLADAVQHWLDHQARFWRLAGPVAILLAALWGAFGLLSKHNEWVAQSQLSELGWMVGTQLIETLVLYQWLKCSLYDDWPRRRALIWRQDAFPWPAFLPGGFFAFWIVYSLLSDAALMAWNNFATSQLPVNPSDTEAVFWAYLMWSVPITQIAFGLIIALFLLFLPASAAGLSWGLGRASREAAGIRLRLTVLFLFWILLPLAGEKCLSTLEQGVFSLGAWPTNEAALAALGFVHDLWVQFLRLFASYLVAQILVRLFVAKTGWTPEPIVDSSGRR